MTSRKKKLPASAASKKRQPAEYEVGYRKPPVNTRFKPGQSGNPAGRAKSNIPRTNRKALLKVVQEEAERLISSTNGELPAVTALVRSAYVHAIKGAGHSQRLLFSLLAKADKENPPTEEIFDWSVYSDEEVATLARLFGKQTGAEND